MTIEEFKKKFEQTDTRILCDTIQERRDALLFLRDVCNYSVSDDRINATQSDYLCPFIYKYGKDVHCTKRDAVFSLQYPYIAFSDLPLLIDPEDICERDMEDFLSVM